MRPSVMVRVTLMSRISPILPTLGETLPPWTRAYTAGVNPDFTRRRFEEVLGAGKDVLCIAVSSALSGS